MQEKPTRIKSKHSPGLVWRPKELSKNIESFKANPKLSPAMKVATTALEKHVQSYFRDFGAGQLAEQAEQERLLQEQETAV